jgi:hypothetical protein
MVGGAHILIQSVNSNSPNIGIHETYTNDSGSYEIALPPGAYMVTASAYEDSETHDVYIQSGHEHELNFSLGEWGWPEPQAIFSLGDGIGTQEGFTVPLYLQTDTPASGLQFAVLPEYTGGGFWFTPSELESTNDCFSASFNDVYSQLWGIMFSLEGCVYEPGEHHVANLSFTVATGSIVPPGTDVQLAFNYTLVSNPDGLEIPSSGQGSTVTFGSPGDVNSDGEVNVLDIVAAVNFILLISEPTDHQYWATDVNEDGHINVLDIVIMVNMILYPDDMGRLDGKAHLMFSPDRILINGENVAGIQLTFSDNVVLESTSLPKGWILKTYGNTIISYRQNGDILYGQTEFNLGSDSELVDYVIADAGGNCITVSKTELPQTVALLPNYPNPFNPETTLSYTLSSEDMVNISVYDITGKLIQTLVNEVQLIGTHQITWHANDLPSGMYISLLSVAGETYTRKIMLMK